MKRNTKIILIIVAGLVVIWIGLRVAGLKSYKIPTASMENTIPIGTRAVVWKKNFTPERFEIIVYRNPDFDTILIPYHPMGYYAAKRQLGSRGIDAKYQKVFVPLSEREEWLGRCVGLPGDNIVIRNGELYINGVLYENENIKKMYFLKTKDNKPIDRKILEQNMIRPEMVYEHNGSYIFSATKSQIENILQSSQVDTSNYFVDQENEYDNMVFPHDITIPWNNDQFGDLLIPQKGKGINLTIDNLPIYRRLIETFENNTLSVSGSTIMINGNAVDSYVPKQDYFFICNDNRDNSFDSRYYGFLPKDHISGKVLILSN